MKEELNPQEYLYDVPALFLYRLMKYTEDFESIINDTYIDQDRKMFRLTNPSVCLDVFELCVQEVFDRLENDSQPAETRDDERYSLANTADEVETFFESLFEQYGELIDMDQEEAFDCITKEILFNDMCDLILRKNFYDNES